MNKWIEYWNKFANEVAWDQYEFRTGEMMFNALNNMDSKLANSLLGTSCDPFYNDENIPEFLEFIRDHWENNS